MCQKKKLLVLINFFFCHYIYVFKKPAAAEVSESIYEGKGKVKPLKSVENNVTKGEIAHFFASLSIVCCRGVRKCLHVGKG